MLKRGVWTPLATFSASDPAAHWFGAYDSIGAESSFDVREQGAARGRGRWSLLGQHNLENALACGVFGSPAYVLDGEVFWGQDRLELLDDALTSGRSPYKSEP